MKPAQIRKLENIWEKNLIGKSTILESMIYRLFTNHERALAINGVLMRRIIQEKFIRKKFHLLPRLMNEFDPKFVNSVKELQTVIRILELRFEVLCGFGTALGLAREGAPLSWDFDFDLIVLSREHRYRYIISQTKKILKKNGINSKRRKLLPELQVVGIESRIDIFFAVQSKKNKEFSIWPDSPGGYQLEMFSPVSKIFFPRLGVFLPMPCNSNAYLSQAYGQDWSTPQQNWDWPFAVNGFEEHFSIHERIYFKLYYQRLEKMYEAIIGRFKSRIIRLLLLCSSVGKNR